MTPFKKVRLTFQLMSNTGGTKVVTVVVYWCTFPLICEATGGLTWKLRAWSYMYIGKVNGQFPSKWKDANITPILTSGDKKDINNFQPISVLPRYSQIV